MSEIPDGLPSLAAGTHKATDGEACAMEYISVLTGNSFSDTPPCTNRTIAFAVQYINDNVSDSDRSMLLPLLPRIARSGYDSPALDRAFREILGHPEWTTHVRLTMVMVYSMVEKLVMPAPARDPRGDWMTRKMRVQDGIDLLNRILDAHDHHARLNGYPIREPEPVTPEALAKAKALIESGTYAPSVGA